MAEDNPKIRIGTSGYYYKDWVGPFYPNDLSFKDRAQFYSHYFDILELNYSYYRLPRARSSSVFIMNSWGQISVTMKATHIFTHKRDYSADDIITFRDAVKPFDERDLFLGILFQFPFSFAFTRENMDYLLRLREQFQPCPFFCEFRNNTWYSRNNVQLLASRQVLLCSSDYPDIQGLPEPKPHLTGDCGYIRFHGRNREKWYNHKQAYERYNYSYSKDELRTWIPKISRISKASRETFIFFNNHFMANSVKNALMLKELINNC